MHIQPAGAYASSPCTSLWRPMIYVLGMARLTGPCQEPSCARVHRMLEACAHNLGFGDRAGHQQHRDTFV
jgi:hypothetical protein